MSLLTIITINLNNSIGLEKSLISIQEQTFKDFQLIIVDGKSTDNSIDIIERYKELIDVAIIEKDTGIYNAMNKGIKQANSEYIYFLNSGDVLYDQNSLSNVFSIPVNSSFICTNFFTETKGDISYQNPYKDRDWSFSIYDIYSSYLCHQAFFIKKTMFDQYGFYNETLKVVADWELFFIAIGIKNESVIYKDSDLVIYNTEGLSSTIGGEFIYSEKQKAIKKRISPYLYDRLDQLYRLEQDQYIVSITKKSKLLNFLVRFYGFIERKLK